MNFIVILLILWFGNKTPKPNNEYSDLKIVESPKVEKQENPRDSISLEELKKNLYYLASDELEGRMSGKKGNIQSGQFIKESFKSYGLQTMHHKFNIKRLNPGPKNETGNDFTQNVYAWIEGNELKDEVVVLGAHFDHIGYGRSMSRSNKIAIHPGADDNASGTVVLLQLAKAFSKLKGKLKRTLVFQAYSAEEMGLIGSRYYCDNPVFPIGNPSMKKHIAMINMDMVGYLGKGRYFAGFEYADSSTDLRNVVESLNQKYNFAKKVTSHGSGGSDHASFYNKKVPVAFLHTGLHDYYHTPADTADKINYDGLKQIADYAFDLTYEVVQGEKTPKFDVVNFKEMSYDHDHGHNLYHKH